MPQNLIGLSSEELQNLDLDSLTATEFRIFANNYLLGKPSDNLYEAMFTAIGMVGNAERHFQIIQKEPHQYACSLDKCPMSPPFTAPQAPECIVKYLLKYFWHIGENVAKANKLIGAVEELLNDVVNSPLNTHSFVGNGTIAKLRLALKDMKKEPS